MIKVYIAAPFFSKEQLEAVDEIESQLFLGGINYYSPRKDGILNDMTDEQRKQKQSFIFNSNISGMDSCTHILANISKYNGARDSGTIFEVGYFSAQKKPIILFCNDIKEMSVMISESARVVYSDLKKTNLAFHGIHNEKHKIGKMN